MAEAEYIIFCDESDKKGAYYSNFYGGLIVGASQYQRITKRLNDVKQSLNLYGEVKWAKVSEQYLSKYQQLISTFFEEVSACHVRVRIMFHQNAHVAQNLSYEQQQQEYFILYYEFIKHGLGLAYIEKSETPTKLRIYVDEIADTRERIEQFRGYIQALQYSPEFRAASLTIQSRSVSEVVSHDHVLLQCLDVVLGSMSFRLNNKHKEKLPGQRRRGKKTIAKERLYKHILAEIRAIRPRFNIGMSTSVDGTLANRWHYPYLHWCFKPKTSIFDTSLTKKAKK
jgi:hypothetical protein